MCGRSLWHIPIGDLRFTPCALEFFHDRTDQLGGSHLLDRHGPVGGVHGIDHKLPAHMSDAGKPDDGLGPTDVGDAEDRSPKFYTVVFATPGRQPPEVKAEDLAISETESSICSVLTLITGMDIEEVAGGRRERLGERASVIAAADAAAMPTPSTSEPRACGRLVRAAHVWLHRATLTMQADDSAHASAMADAALRCGDDGSDNAEALLVRAKVATALAETRTDMLAGERAVLAATRASVRACDLNDGEKDGACLAYDAVLASARASIGEAERASTIVMNDRKYDAEMQHAESVLEGAPGLVQGLPMADRPELGVEFELLSGRLEELVHINDSDPGWSHLDAAIERSREAMRLVLAGENGLFLGECCLQLWRQLQRRWPDPSKEIAAEQQLALVNGLLNSSPMSRISFELLLAWAKAFYVGGHLVGDDRRSLFGAAIWHKCCYRLRARNPALCFEAAAQWGRFTELVANQTEAAVPYAIATETAKELTRRPGTEGHIGRWLARTSEAQSFATAALASSGEVVRAVEIAESGRSVLQQVGLCLPDELAALDAAGHGRLAKAYSQARSAQRLVVSGVEKQAQPAPWDLSERYHSLLGDANDPLQAATEAVRELPDFGDFPRSPPFRRLREAARDAPLVYVAAGLTGGVALLLRNALDDAPERILLPELQHEAVDDRTYRLRHAFSPEANPFKSGGWAEYLDSVGEWLWDALVGKLLDATDGAPWIRVIPLGLTALLPIHTAWTRSGNGRVHAIDSTAFSYLPSATLEIHAQTRAVGDRWKALLVEGDDLVAAASEVVMRGAPMHHAQTVSPSGAQATPTAFLREIENCNLVHVSAHGFVDEGEPVESGFRLSGDRIVRVKQLRAPGLGNLGLLILPSCESALAATTIPDQTYGLAGLFYGP